MLSTMFTPGAEGNSSMLISVQYGRALAALLVVWTHLSGFAVFAPLASGDAGGFGVDIFFVISGFIMWTSASHQKPAAFIVRRLARIVPAYWFYTLLLIGMSVVAPRLTPNVKVDVDQILCSLLFIPHTNYRGELNPILLQGWTLNCEMYFYAVFALALLINRPNRRFLAIAAFFGVSAIAGLILKPQQDVLKAYTSTIFLEFVLGMALSLVARRKMANEWWCHLLLVAATIGFYLATQRPSAPALRFINYGFPSAILLYGLLGLEGRFRRNPSTRLMQLGNASYSLYLVHPFFLSATAVLMMYAASAGLQKWPVIMAASFGLVAVLGCCFVALLSYKILEQPTNRLVALYRF